MTISPALISPTSAASTVRPLQQLFTATIADTGTVSDAVDLGCFRPAVLYKPAEMEGTAITFQVSPDGVTWYPLKDAANANVAIVTTTATAEAHVLPRASFDGVAWLKIVAGTSQTDELELIIGAEA